MTTVDTATEVRPFQLKVPEEQVDELRERIGATRWPSKELPHRDHVPGMWASVVAAVESCALSAQLLKRAGPRRPLSDKLTRHFMSFSPLHRQRNRRDPCR
jgi:hypothetical protein